MSSCYFLILGSVLFFATSALSAADSIPIGLGETQSWVIPVNGEISHYFYLSGYKKTGEDAFQVTAWIDSPSSADGNSSRSDGDAPSLSMRNLRNLRNAGNVASEPSYNKREYGDDDDDDEWDLGLAPWSQEGIAAQAMNALALRTRNDEQVKHSYDNGESINDMNYINHGNIETDFSGAYRVRSARSSVVMADPDDVTLEVYLRKNAPPTMESYTSRHRIRIQLFNQTYGWLAESVDYGMDNSADRWFGGIFARRLNDSAVDNTTTSMIGVKLNANWGNDLCARRRDLPLFATQVTKCAFVNHDLHKVPGWLFREDGVALQERQVLTYRPKNSDYCSELTRNVSCAYWYPICDTGGWKLPVCQLMCFTWVTDCLGVTTFNCRSAPSGFCTGFPIPGKGLNSAAILLIVIVSLMLTGILVGCVIGYFRKKHARELAEEERDRMEQGQTADTFGITAGRPAPAFPNGPNSTPPVLHQAVVHIPAKKVEPRQVRTFETTTGFDDVGPGGTQSSDEEDDSD